MLSRRTLIAGGAASALVTPALAERLADLALPGGPSIRPLRPVFPQKREMIVQRVRPPLLETPMQVFDEGVFTPNNRFFVRWHWPFPQRIEARSHRVAIRGAVRSPLLLSLDEIVGSGEPIEFAAVNQCAGNGRGLFEPRVAGAQWANGAMGNARWRGVRLRDVLDRAGVNAGAKFVRFRGLDTPPVETAPTFMKSLPIDIARRDDTIIAYAMNGEALPLLNGYPLRLIVPGWFSTYWVKMLSDIEVLSEADTNFWMAKAYRIPTVPVKPGDKDFPSEPISTMGPRSFVTSHADGAVIRAGQASTGVALRGIAMGGDAAVAKVELHVGDGTFAATLGPDDGRYGFRRWTATVPVQTGSIDVAVRCTNTNGIAQPDVSVWNPNGYARNGVERIRLEIP